MGEVVAPGTSVRYGSEDGSVTVFNEGDTVSGLTDEQLESLRSSGVLVKQTGASELTPEQRQRKIEQLEQQLAELNAVTPVPSPGVAAEQLMTATAESRGDTTVTPSEAGTQTQPSESANQSGTANDQTKTQPSSDQAKK